jgi:mercuric ion binding protein
MKTVKIVIVVFLAIAMGSNSFAQTQDHSKMDMSKTKTDSKMELTNTKTETFKVWGNCESCQKRIQKAAKIDGVTKAEWNKDTKLLTLVYNPLMVKSDDVLKKIASVGHDTEKFKADTKVYNSLDGCCQYDRK